MNDEIKIRKLSNKIAIIDIAVMLLSILLQIADFNALRNVIFCSCILLGIIVILILDVILRDRRNFLLHSVWLVAWLFNLIVSLFTM